MSKESCCDETLDTVHRRYRYGYGWYPLVMVFVGRSVVLSPSGDVAVGHGVLMVGEASYVGATVTCLMRQ
ncbi:hypothetical protein BDV98DRAFT_285029 [Pterulicium gracile]|uniref:Uncharacterized protein n=1 Tax=Pterulicium gracile TaxID=1884261 RepID=A0A5C3QT12_9AGAR|nr:hypothetical protein BDV98DRAFT_285029 [Pterula gracilis]